MYVTLWRVHFYILTRKQKKNVFDVEKFERETHEDTWKSTSHFLSLHCIVNLWFNRVVCVHSILWIIFMSKLMCQITYIYIWKLDESKFHQKKSQRNIYCIIAHMVTVYSFVSIEIALRQWDLQIKFYRSFDFRCSVEPTAAIQQKNLIEKLDACVCDKRSQRKHLSLFVCAAVTAAVPPHRIHSRSIHVHYTAHTRCIFCLDVMCTMLFTIWIGRPFVNI